MIDESGFLPAPLPSNESRRLEAVRRTGVMDVAKADLFIVYNELAKQIILESLGKSLDLEVLE